MARMHVYGNNPEIVDLSDDDDDDEGEEGEEEEEEEHAYVSRAGPGRTGPSGH